MVKAITLGRESYHFTLRKLSFLTVKAMLLQHKKVRHGSQNESKRTFFAFILFFKKRPSWKSRFTATLSHSTPPMGSCSTTAEKCAQNEFSVFRTFRTFYDIFPFAFVWQKKDGNRIWITVLLLYLVHHAEEAQHIVKVSHYHKQEQDAHTHVLGI